MELSSLVAALAAWPGARWLQGSGTAYLFVNAAHVLSISLLLGSILVLDLRLLGGLRSVPLGVLGPLNTRVAACGVGLAVVTGLWLFTVQPKDYLANPAFLIKLLLLAAALANVLVQHANPGWRQALAGSSVSASVRICAALSALLWLCMLVAGRWIGFV